jgi:phosphopantothenoylcysteine decarboxylase/phosphopantothenate--cysteine ligase
MTDLSVQTVSTLAGKRILLGVTGSIAAFKVAGWVREMTAESVGVTVVMTEAAERFVSALTFGTLAGSPVYLDMFAGDYDNLMAHISLSLENDLILIAPATAQTIARLAHGMADDLLSTIVLAAKIQVVVCPAMNSRMLAHPATRTNLKRLSEFGYTVVDPDSGLLACGEEGTGRLSDWGVVREKILAEFCLQDLKDKKIVITAGPTREPIDPVRFLSNRSSGKMGFALARTAVRRGAVVTLVCGPNSLDEPPFIDTVQVTTAEEMRTQVMSLADDADIIVKAAAVADFRPREYKREKIKKQTAALSLQLEKNNDILMELGRKKRADCLLIGFAAESQNHEAQGMGKLIDKNVDMILVNDITSKQSGFDVETNQVTILSRESRLRLPLLSKEDTANRIWDFAVSL